MDFDGQAAEPEIDPLSPIARGTWRKGFQLVG
jgi:hypothetical protein